MTSREYTEIVATIAVEQDQDKLERIVTMAKSAIQTLKRRELRQETFGHIPGADARTTT